MQPTTSNTPAHVQLPTALIRRPAVERLTGMSRSRIYDLMDKGEFPRPVRLGSMSVAWLETEIREWIFSRIADSRKTAGA